MSRSSSQQPYSQDYSSSRKSAINNTNNDLFDMRDDSVRSYPLNSNRYDASAYSPSWRIAPTAYGFESRYSDNTPRQYEQFRSSNTPYDSTGSGARSHSYDDLITEQNRPQTFYNSSVRSGGIGGIDRNTFGHSHQQLNTTDDDLTVKSTDLSAPHEQEMLELIRAAFRKYDLQNQREIAGFLKRGADKTFQSCWHCIVGRQFSSYVTHEMNGFIYLTKGPLSILLFKSGC
ncbi:unnamed protein product [Didymodactylos carnosus]|uniref:Dynein light chain 1, cytoplasmic n=1 Tax=Didymodactylos carnosus TaxID=1234261 RepID=A0A813UAC3_9BILA|nr:unnamed protein product [Didymodactylos carnosus]CAF1140009.1 unnamed protein product [Didymodactylos carnosus]CAF3612853.1 unnamed protein product [Didymodactylos carnosus]CAF3933958.1 unnamed protein product [Didymodactylos carnosus]